jgi:hypothetical protein
LIALSVQLDVHPDSAVAPTSVGISELADVMTRTLPEDGMDRMTDEHVEEILAVPALTAHI